MANTNANVKKLPGGATETAVDLAARMIDKQLAVCPFEGVLVYKNSASSYTTYPNTAEVQALIAASGSVEEAPVDGITYGRKDGVWVDLANIGDFAVKTETADFTAEASTIHLVETSSIDIVCTIPNAIDDAFQTRIYKVTSIDTPDVICSTPAGQLLGGSANQILQGLSEGIYAVSHTDHYEIIQDNRGSVQRKLSQSTSVISGFAISQNGIDANKIDVGTGIFSEELAAVDPTPPASSNLSTPESKLIKTEAKTAVTITGLATDGFTVFQITPAGAIVQTLNDVPTQDSENINPKIAVIVHAGGVVLSAESWWTVGQNPSKRVSWLLSKLGVLKEGITMFGAGVGNLQFAHDTGTISYAGADGEKSPNNPDEQPVAAADPVAGFILTKQDAFINFAQTVIDPTQIDVAGTLTALTGIDKVSIQRIFINLNGTFSVQYGQNGYATIAEGLTALAEGTDTFIRFNVISKVSRICAYLIVDRACTDLTNPAQAQFVQTGLLESDGSLSSTSELVTILKALQNGKDAGGLGIDNLGTTAIGNTANPWTVFEALEIHEASFIGRDGFATSDVVANAYYDGGWKKKITGLSTRMQQFDGETIFSTSASDVAGAGFTWAEVMRIDENGNVGIGTATPAYDVVISDNGGVGFEFAPALVAGQATLLTVDRATGNYTDNASFCKEYKVSTGADSGSSRTLALTVSSDGTVSAPAMSISDITADKTLVTKEYVSDWVDITSTFFTASANVTELGTTDVYDNDATFNVRGLLEVTVASMVTGIIGTVSPVPKFTKYVTIYDLNTTTTLVGQINTSGVITNVSGALADGLYTVDIDYIY